MGAETLNGEARVLVEAKAPLILGLQPAALIDHVARADCSLLDQIPGERGGSIPVAIEELEHILSELKKHNLASVDGPSPMKTMAGGSVANTIQGLSSGFGVNCGMIGAYGDDEQGQLFVSNMNISGVNISRLRKKIGPTGQCVCLVDAFGNRTMRPCLSTAVKVKGGELTKEDFSGSKMVRNFRVPLLQLLESGVIDLCFANEDEATELIRGEENAEPEAALEYLSKYCRWAVVTLGPNGCIAKYGQEIVRVPAIGEAKAVDATGAGDLFTGRFLYGLVKRDYLSRNVAKWAHVVVGQ
ncbi:hypothetical protein CRYUN_Cryun28dG0097500 [Craigia yunnanensis]